jgi:hypothetical protein
MVYRKGGKSITATAHFYENIALLAEFVNSLEN